MLHLIGGTYIRLLFNFDEILYRVPQFRRILRNLWHWHSMARHRKHCHIQTHQQQCLSYPARPFLEGGTSRLAHLDSDSSTLMVLDNGSSYYMTNNKNQFIEKTTAVSRRVHGLGSAMILLEGTIRWSWEDDDGVVHTKDIPGTQYCPELPYF